MSSSQATKAVPAPKTHIKSRGYISEKVKSENLQYSTLEFSRFDVPAEFVSFDKKFQGYQPTEIDPMSKRDPQPSYADPTDPKKINDFNQGNRGSYHGNYKVSATGYPRNPVGRTGATGRGRLGKWGPNHAADPLVLRRKPGFSQILQFVAIKRKDTGEWAIPGGMVEFGDNVSATLMKEFLEETQNSLAKSSEQQALLEKEVKKIFSCPQTIYEGYVDDPRNTDNSWMETSCTLFFDKTGELTKNIELEAGDDAGDAAWVDIPDDVHDLKLYASHVDFLVKAVEAVKKMPKPSGPLGNQPGPSTTCCAKTDNKRKNPAGDEQRVDPPKRKRDYVQQFLNFLNIGRKKDASKDKSKSKSKN